jgi:3',5'-cyclic AMP phosphodiesterase CpdA
MNSDSALTFVHMSDPHVGHHAEAEATFERALEDVAALRPRPSFILMTGDLTEGEVAHYRTFRRLADASPVPVVALPGNHDVGGRLCDRSWSKIDRFREQIGHDYRVFEHVLATNDTPFGGGETRPSSYRFILLNSLFLRAPSKVLSCRSPRLRAEVDAQWEFLDRSLADSARGVSPARSVFIAFHHTPYAVHRKGPAGGYLPISRASRRRLFGLCDRWNVQAVLSGHAHWSREVLHGRTALITTPSVSYNSPFGPGGKLPLGYRVITAQGDRLFYRYKSLDLSDRRPFWVIGLRQGASDGRYLDHLDSASALARAASA